MTTSFDRTPPKIISASRRTDILRFYSRWMLGRVGAGFAEFRNSFGGKGRASLRREDVLAYLFWTRLAGPGREVLTTLRDQGIPMAFQYTITGYGRDIERCAPSTGVAIDDFLEVSSALPDPACIQWRYDPIVISDTYPVDWHTRTFEGLAGRLRGATRVVNTSFVEPYLKTVRRLADPSVAFRRPDPKRHKTVVRRYPDLRVVDGEGHRLLADLREIAAAHDMELRVCSNPEWNTTCAISQCCSPELYAPYGQDFLSAIEALGDGPSRAGCQCLSVVDIGMDNTCVGDCLYCYVVTSQKTAVANLARHDSSATALR